MSDAPSLCPRDGHPVREFYLGAFRTWSCRECGGVWIDRDELRGYLERPVDAWRPEHVPKRRKTGTQSVLRCECSEVDCMERFQKREVTVDFCRRCGRLWLDGGELEGIASRSRFRALTGPPHAKSNYSGADTAIDEFLDGLFDALLDALTPS